jgi:hypothetical protein
MAEMKELNDILKLIDEGSAKFESAIPNIEKKIFREISLLLKDLKTTAGGKIEPSMENLKLINEIKSKLGKILSGKEYAAAVNKFVQNIPAISNFQTATAGLPKEARKILTETAKMQIESTLEGLIGAGYKQTVTKQLRDMLQTNVTSGSSYNSMIETLQKALMGVEEKPGMLSKYAKTYVTDTLGQFAGQGNKIVATALKSEWFQYVGSNLTTTREFCRHLTKKRYVHISEFPEILKGVIDGHECKINPATGLWPGAKDGTNADNFIENRGGWNCGHELIPVDEAGVPKAVREKINGVDLLEKVKEAQKPYEKNTFVAFEPISATIIEKLSKVKDEKSKQKLLKEVIEDDRFKALDLGLNTDVKTTIFPGSKINSNRQDTLEIAKDLNNRGISIHFLPESDTLASADAIIEYKGKLIVADLKYSKSVKNRTIYTDMRNGFSKSQMIVMKASKADMGIISQSIDELVRKGEIKGDLLLINRLGREMLVTKNEINNGKYKNKLRGHL